jgi:TctA family transporter
VRTGTRSFAIPPEQVILALVRVGAGDHGGDEHVAAIINAPADRPDMQAFIEGFRMAAERAGVQALILRITRIEGEEVEP